MSIEQSSAYAQPPVPPKHAVEWTAWYNKVRPVGLLVAAVLFVSAWLPWWTVSAGFISITVNGYSPQGDGPYFVGMAALLAVAACFNSRRWSGIFAALIGLSAVAEIVYTYHKAAGSNVQVSPGLGLFTLLIVGFAAGVWGLFPHLTAESGRS